MRLAVAAVEPRKGPEQSRVALRRHDRIELGKLSRIEAVVSGAPRLDIARQQRKLELLGHIDPRILQLDPNRYRDPSQLPAGGVLVVGAGNSGAEIAFEVSRTHPTWLSGPATGHIPIRTGSRWDRLLTPPFWWFVSRVLTVQTPIGRKARPKALTTTSPLERAGSATPSS